MRRKLFIVASFLTLLFLSSGDALAEHRITTVHGTLGALANGKSILRTSGDKGYYFDPTSAAGRKILSTCQIGTDCIVRGVINGRVILNAYYVKAGK